MPEFWRGKRVVIIGGAGMIGSSLAGILHSAGARVLIVDDYSHGKGIDPVAGPVFIKVDATNQIALSNVINLHEPTHIFNLAAYVAGVEYNMTHQFEMFSKNALLQLIPLQVAVEYGKAKFLQTSSVCVYAPGYNNPANDIFIGGKATREDPTEANAGYSQAKRIGEIAVQNALKSGLDAVVVRPTNCYGPRDYYDERAHVIPALIRKAFDDDVIKVNSGPEVIREFIHSEDAASGMMAAMERGIRGYAYILGATDDAVSMNTLAELIREECDVKKKIVYGVTANGIDENRCTDSNFTYRLLKWKPAINLRAGLRNAITWYKEHR